jgi:carbon storage regulator
MLVLSRKSQQSVMIGGADGFQSLLKVTVLGIRGANVKLGFEVDADVPIHRLEVWERVRAESGLQEGQAEGLSDPVDTDNGGPQVCCRVTSCDASRVIAEDEV